MDDRIKKYAHTLVNYSLSVEEENFVLIRGFKEAYPLIEACYEEVIKAGAHPYVIFKHDLDEILLKQGNSNQLSYVPSFLEEMMKRVDRLISIGGSSNTRYLSNVDPMKISLYNKAHSKLSRIQMKRSASGQMKWTLCMYPTQSAAQEAGMSLREYEEFVFEACRLNDDDPISSWENISVKQQRIIDYLNRKKSLRIVSDGTDIEMSIEDRKWINSDGRTNFPSGEVFTAPVEETVNGFIRFSFPGIYSGNEIEDVSLKFEDGKVVEAKASKGQRLLDELLDSDEGAKMVGEVAVGTNYNIRRFTKNMLFDEKIGGTVHIALGRSYPQSGGKNQSAIHWDMLCDMRSGGKIFVDGEQIYEDGEFTVDFT